VRFFRFSAAAVLCAALACAPVIAEEARAVIDSVLSNESGLPGASERITASLSQAVSRAETPSDRRSLLVFLASVQERSGQYDAASRSYALAAGIAAPPAPDMPRVSAEQLVIDAVRCALLSGDFSTAESYLSSSVRNSADPAIFPYVRLYTAWCQLSKAQTEGDIAAAAALLDSYAENPSMENVRPAVLLTLWYIAPVPARRNALVQSYPDSPEAAVAQGTASLIPSPFWYFLLPGVSVAESEQSARQNTQPEQNARQNTQAADTAGVQTLQLGIFRNRENAEKLANDVQKSGFGSVIVNQEREGTDYFVVTVRNASEDTRLRLKEAGFDSFFR
jgi:cell division septation protein DedD